MIRENAVEAVGGTPLVRLGRLHPAGNLAAKVEYMNPAGSVKERIAVNMIDRAEQQGLLGPGGDHRGTHFGQHRGRVGHGGGGAGLPGDMHRARQGFSRKRRII